MSLQKNAIIIYGQEKIREIILLIYMVGVWEGWRHIVMTHSATNFSTFLTPKFYVKSILVDFYSLERKKFIFTNHSVEKCDIIS